MRLRWEQLKLKRRKNIGSQTFPRDCEAAFLFLKEHLSEEGIRCDRPHDIYRKGEAEYHIELCVGLVGYPYQRCIYKIRQMKSGKFKRTGADPYMPTLESRT